MIRKIHVWLWGIVAELEYRLYPWQNYDAPKWAIDRYNLDCENREEEYEYRLNFDWLKHHEEKIGKLQLEMLSVIAEIEKLKGEK